MNLKHFIISLWTAFCAALLAVGTAHAQLEIDITKGNIDPTPIAVPSFLGTDTQTRELGQQIPKLSVRIWNAQDFLSLLTLRVF